MNHKETEIQKFQCRSGRITETNKFNQNSSINNKEMLTEITHKVCGLYSLYGGITTLCLSNRSKQVFVRMTFLFQLQNLLKVFQFMTLIDKSKEFLNSSIQ